MVKYGLRHKKSGNVVGFYVRAEGDESGFDTIYELDYNEKQMWLVDSPEHAEYVRNYPAKWYNAGEETPKHGFKPEELEVIKIELIQSVEPLEVKLPSYEEFVRAKYNNKRDEVKLALYHANNREYDPENAPYTIWDLLSFIRRRQK